LEGASRIYTELQRGSYVSVETGSGRKRDRNDGPSRTFEPSLVV
jgi:hypothetical protein